MASNSTFHHDVQSEVTIDENAQSVDVDIISAPQKKRLTKWYKRTKTPTLALTLVKTNDGQLCVKYSGPKQFEAFGKSKSVAKKFTSIVLEGMKADGVDFNDEGEEDNIAEESGIDDKIVEVLTTQNVHSFSISRKRKLISQIITGIGMFWLWTYLVLAVLTASHIFINCGCNIKSSEMQGIQKFRSDKSLKEMFRRWDAEIKKYVAGIVKRMVPSKRMDIFEIGKNDLFFEGFFNFYWLLGSDDMDEIHKAKTSLSQMKNLYQRQWSKIRLFLSFFDFIRFSRYLSKIDQRTEKQTLQKHHKNLGLLVKKHFGRLLSNPKKHIVNLSDYSLSDSEEFVLEHGLEFCIPPREVNREELFAEFEVLFAQLARHEPVSDNELGSLKARLSDLAHAYCGTPIDLTDFYMHREHFQTIKSLRNSRDIPITKPDKGSGVVILNQKDYITKMGDILNDNSKIGDVEKFDKTARLERKLQKRLHELVNKKQLTQCVYDRMRPGGSQRPRMYGLPKSHKPNIPLRPILSMVGSAQHQLAKWLSELLEPVLNLYSDNSGFFLLLKIVKMNSQNGAENSEKEALRKLFCGGLQRHTSDNTFRSYFKEFGDIVDIVIIRDKHTNESKSFGFVTYNNSISVLNVLASKPHIIDGRTVDVKRAIPKENKTETAHDFPLKSYRK
eukprot:gene10355-11432_t